MTKERGCLVVSQTVPTLWMSMSSSFISVCECESAVVPFNFRRKSAACTKMSKGPSLGWIHRMYETIVMRSKQWKDTGLLNGRQSTQIWQSSVAFQSCIRWTMMDHLCTRCILTVAVWWFGVTNCESSGARHFKSACNQTHLNWCIFTLSI